MNGSFDGALNKGVLNRRFFFGFGSFVVVEGLIST